MRRFPILIAPLALLLALNLVACGNKGPLVRAVDVEDVDVEEDVEEIDEAEDAEDDVIEGDPVDDADADEIDVPPPADPGTG